MRNRPAAFAGSVLLLVGALVIGAVIHQVLVESTLELVSGRALLGLGGGLVLVAVGMALERRSELPDVVGNPDPVDDGAAPPPEEYVFEDGELDHETDA